jgi:hypothetical protein
MGLLRRFRTVFGFWQRRSKHQCSRTVFSRLMFSCRKEYQAAVKEFEKLIQTYPQSAYTDKAYEQKGYIQWNYLNQYPQPLTHS